MTDFAGLDEIARGHVQARGFTPRLLACRARTLETLLPPGRVLDLGCSDGILTARLGARHPRVVAVDGSAIRLERARAATRHLPSVELRHSLFRDFDPGGERFDGIVLSCVLEHEEDPVGLLRLAAGWLAPDGRLVAIVPNGRSLHRRAGVHMGLLASLDELGEADHALHHERLYTGPLLAADFLAAGLRVIEQGGHLLKPLPNDDMAALPESLVAAYEQLGREMPDLAAEAWCCGAHA